MYSEKNLLYFNPYYFEDGSNKNKYFVVIKSIENNLIIASLPTSKDHIPDYIERKTGCINIDESRINCYLFIAGDIISECGSFGFPLNTYLYGEQVDVIDKNKLESIYQKEGIDYKVLGKLSDDIYSSIIECLKKSTSIKRKIKKHI